ncbi:aminotransferase class V-fold PLP-dependent enzyme [Pullulanibacillus sp. KACC 23026]|uniref:aminotransferase class I/II-fold pyridoxal phosphate-dependent enzyme n=1 Tax=Pullulanibacillus sp. KACC 23026 TaxID=3028315 RepID=UPI0023AF50AC|nr:aminotransferase class I/II-fold pyridoxal phosphate-dependent enzyme [Pullulanibacillus sp. KACC 23026]WEG12754.1 aminotransferase class V-fold PLP-dependent enzyme [Pullulanibacillus sp. KACC 23026]
MDHNRTPIMEALQVYEQREIYSFHVPGHKSGKVWPDHKKAYFKDILRIDATELEGLDDLYAPAGALLEAELLLSDYYQTKHSFLLVNGSTVGNLTMILSSCHPGDTLLVQRNAHQSIFNALKLANVKAVFLEPVRDPFTKMGVGLTEETLVQALQQFPEAKGLVLTYPNYYGQTLPVEKVILLAKQAGLGVMVDEAHGPHFKWGFPFPSSCLEYGADMVVHSAHKLLPSMTMGAYLHLNSDWVSKDRVLNTIKMLQTSSPSYPIMASLDIGRSFLATLEPSGVSQILGSIKWFKKQLTLMGFRVDPTPLGQADPLKLAIQREGYTGYELKRRFESVGLYPEMADSFNLLLVLGWDLHPPFDDIIDGLSQMEWEIRPSKPERPTVPLPLRLQAIPFTRMASEETELIRLTTANGKRTAENVVPYPPGVPVLIEGEEITEEAIQAIYGWKQNQVVIHGLIEKEGDLWIKINKR